VIDRARYVNLFGPADDPNYWRYLFIHDVVAWGGWVTICLVFLFWLLVNAPEYYKMSVIYLSMLMISVVAALSGDLYPGARDIGMGFIGTGPLSDYPRNIVLGMSIGFGFVALQSMFLSVVVPTQLFSISNFLIMNVILVGFIIPFIEEMIFNAAFVPVMSQRIGAVPAVVISAVAFGVFHWFVFGGAFVLIFMAFLFRLVAATSIVVRWSTLPGYVGHIIVNVVAVLGQVAR